MSALQRLKLALCILCPFFRSSQKAYRVMWSRPGYSETEAGRFSTYSNAEATAIFEERFKSNQQYLGDKLVLYLVAVKEELETVSAVEAVNVVEHE